jgi:hypothetical protein
MGHARQYSRVTSMLAIWKVYFNVGYLESHLFFTYVEHLEREK